MGLVIICVALLFPVLIIGWIIWWSKRKARRKEAENEKARTGGFAARARIVDLRQADTQRSGEFTLFKLLLEISPAESASEPFSTTVVWEIEASALSAMQTGVVIPVKVDKNNLRRIFPDLTGARYSETYQHVYLGIKNDFEVEQIIAAAQIAPQAAKPNTIYRKRSKTKIFGLPLWEVAFNLIGKKGNVRYQRLAKARAIVAIGDSATGIVAIGSFAKGIVAVGQTALGVFAFGAGTFGIFAIGLMSVGLFSIGALSVGFIGFGAIVLSYISAGFLTISRYTFNLDGRSSEIIPYYNILKNLSGLNDEGMKMIVEYGVAAIVVASFAFFILWFIINSILVRKLQPNDNQLESPRRMNL